MIGSAALRRGVCGALIASLLMPSAALSAPATTSPIPANAPADALRPWLPLDRPREASARDGDDLSGLLAMDPIRLDLTQGGWVEGALLGVDRQRRLVSLLRPGGVLEVGLDLVAAVTPGVPRPSRGEDGAPLPEPLRSVRAVTQRYALRPTWRSHLGVALSVLLPGTGQFIQEENRRVGWVFLSAWTFVVSAGVLALAVPPQPASQQRITAAVTLFGVGLAFNVVAAIHAFQQGRRRLPVRGRRRPNLTDGARNE